MVDTSRFRHGMRVSGKADGIWYQRLSYKAGEWWLTGNCRYSDVLASRAERIDIPVGRVEDFDLLASNTIYVRLGSIPACGRSRNFRDNSCEPGVSCFRAAWDGDTLVVEANAGAILFDSPRPLYEISGELCGLGSDDEPLLDGAKIVREINRDNVRFAR